MTAIDWNLIRERLSLGATPADMPPEVHGAAQAADRELAGIIARRREVARTGGLGWSESPKREHLRELNDEYATRFRAFVAEQCEQASENGG